MKRWIAALLCSAFAWAMAQEPTVALVDTASGGGPGGGLFFVLQAVDGKEVRSNAISASRAASLGRGAYMAVRPFEHTVPAGRALKLRIVGTQVHAAPIQSIFKDLFGDGVPRVEGEVTVTLEAGRRYHVNGIVDSLRREVWIEDARGRPLDGATIVAKPDPELLKAMEGAAFTTLNLRYEGDWIGNGPVPELPFVPAGARLKVVEVGRDRAKVLVNGRKMRVGIDWTEGGETVQQFIARITSGDDPRPAMDAWPAAVREAVRAGRVMPGMTRQQVLTALGPPRPDLTRSLDGPEWAYGLQEGEEVFMVFADDGTLKAVDASRKARGLLVYAPPVQALASAPAPAASATASGAPAPAAASAPR